MTSDRARAFRERHVREATEPRILEVVHRFYPTYLSARILACCQRARASNYARACRHHLCPVCNSTESWKIAAKQYAAFQSCTPPGVKGPRLAHEVYTLPPDLRARVAVKAGFDAWKRATLATIRAIHGADVAGIMNLHPIGDLDITRFHPHWDVLINGYLLGKDGPKEHRPRRIAYDEARVLYKKHLVRELALTGDDVPDVVDLWLDRKRSVFHTSRAKTHHLVRYSSRHIYLPHRAWYTKSTAGQFWAYRPDPKRGDTRYYEPHRAMSSLLAIDDALRGRKRRVWFGHMQDRLRSKSVRRYADAGGPDAPEDAA